MPEQINGCLMCRIFGHKNAEFVRIDDEEKVTGFVCKRCYAETRTKYD